MPIMKCYYSFLLLLSLHSTTLLHAQDKWTKQDSIWLQRVLSGKEKLQLNDDAKKTIESGNLLSPDPYTKEQMKMKSAELPIMKSFEGITAPELKHKLKPDELPPPVYKLYGMDLKDSLPDVTRSTFFDRKTTAELKRLYGIPPLDPSNKILIRLIVVKFDSEDIMRTIFWPSHRAKKRNKKNANTWKTYNNGY